jgi:hypothetical protein
VSDHDPIPPEEGMRLRHRYAVRLNLRAEAAYAADAARRLVASARTARLPVPRDVERAADVLAWAARFIADQLDRELAERARLGLDAARYQRHLERHPPRPPGPPQT